MDSSAAISHTERVTHLFIAVMEKLVTMKAINSLGPEMITCSQLIALRFISRNKAPLMGEIASGLRVSLPAATKAIDRLVRKGLAVRREDPTDRRVVRIYLTDLGVSLQKEVCQRQSEILEGIMLNMPEETRLHFINGIESFVRAAITDESIVDEICLHCGDNHVEDCIARQELSRLRSTNGAGSTVKAQATSADMVS